MEGMDIGKQHLMQVWERGREALLEPRAPLSITPLDKEIGLPFPHMPTISFKEEANPTLQLKAMNIVAHYIGKFYQVVAEGSTRDEHCGPPHKEILSGSS